VQLRRKNSEAKGYKRRVLEIIYKEESQEKVSWRAVTRERVANTALAGGRTAPGSSQDEEAEILRHGRKNYDD
jgi:hypothetical protein